MTPELSRRIAHAFAAGFADPHEQAALIEAAGPREVRSVEDMPQAAQDLLHRLEHRGSPQPSGIK